MRPHSSAQLIERLQELERESVEFHEEENTWYYALGCVLGELSGLLFPATSEEYAHWNSPLMSMPFDRCVTWSV